MRRSLFTAVCMAAITILSVSACKTLPTVNQQAGITVAIDIAAGFAIQQHDTDQSVWKARAAQYKAIALQLQALNNAGTATLATLQADLEPLIAKLPPADVLAAHALVAAVTPYVQQQISTNPKVANTQAAVAVVLQAVIDACTAYGA